MKDFTSTTNEIACFSKPTGENIIQPIQMKSWQKVYVPFFLVLIQCFGSLQLTNAQCTNATQYPAGTINAATGSLVTISASSNDNNYSVITGITSGASYEFSISRSNDYITVRIGSAGGTLLAFGPTPLTVTATSASDLYVHWNKDNGCGTINSSNRTTTVQAVPTITSLGSTSGCVGTSITINGTNLSGATAANVKIGGTAVTAITTNTSTQIVATIGSGTTGPVTVTNGAVTATSASTFTVNQLPTITTSATAAAVCFSSSSQTSTLSYSATTNSPINYTITWNLAATGAGLVNVSSTALPASPITFPVTGNVVAGTYTGTLTVTNANGCSNAGSSFTFTINPLPTITTSASATAKCYSGSAQNSSLSYSATTNSPTTISSRRVGSSTVT